MQQQQQQQQQQQGGGGGADLQMRGGNEEEEELVLATWDCGSPLYDSFELASLHYVLEKHTMVLPFVHDAAAVSRSRRRSLRRHHHHRGGAATVTTDMAKTGSRSAARRTRVWRGSKAAAAIFRAVTCFRSSV